MKHSIFTVLALVCLSLFTVTSLQAQDGKKHAIGVNPVRAPFKPMYFSAYYEHGLSNGISLVFSGFYSYKFNDSYTSDFGSDSYNSYITSHTTIHAGFGAGFNYYFSKEVLKGFFIGAELDVFVQTADHYVEDDYESPNWRESMERLYTWDASGGFGVKSKFVMGYKIPIGKTFFIEPSVGLGIRTVFATAYYTEDIVWEEYYDGETIIILFSDSGTEPASSVTPIIDPALTIGLRF